MSNAARGAEFEASAAKALDREFGYSLRRGFKLGIGSPAKPHEFDLGSTHDQVLAECKRVTWTATGNNPSAKITSLREAAFYLRLAPGAWTRLLVLEYSAHPKRTESLACHFVRLNSHLLGGIGVIEIAQDASVSTLVPPVPK